jgi:DnaJ like chaperone protein
MATNNVVDLICFMKHRGYKKALLERLSGKCIDIPPGGSTELILTDTLFFMLGKLAKHDGRVSKQEIIFAEKAIEKLGLVACCNDSGNSRKHAITSFERGKGYLDETFDFVNQLTLRVGRGSDLSWQLLRLLCGAALLKKTSNESSRCKGHEGVSLNWSLRLKDRVFLRGVAEKLGFDKAELIACCDEIHKESCFGLSVSQKGNCEAYNILEIEPGAELSVIRKAYLKQMAKNHPDKLEAQAPNEEVMLRAKDQVNNIRNAYEILCVRRGART